jgi:hypothetical protein
MPKIHVIDTEGRWQGGNVDEQLWWPRVMWIDPGTVSGVAVVWFDPKALLVDDLTMPKVLLAYSEIFLSGPENGINGQVNRFMRLRRGLEGEAGLATGCESFTILKENQSYEFLSPVRIRAALEGRLSIMKPHGSETVGDGVPVWTQSPSDAITSFSNERLKNLRMYSPGPDHVNDAKRHDLLWIRKLKGRGMDFFQEAHGYEEGWFK